MRLVCEVVASKRRIQIQARRRGDGVRQSTPQEGPSGRTGGSRSGSVDCTGHTHPYRLPKRVLSACVLSWSSRSAVRGIKVRPTLSSEGSGYALG
eukprot:scaffold1457_cov350-Prasinococcus_capsulatus_cf.AAC.15